MAVNVVIIEPDITLEENQKNLEEAIEVLTLIAQESINQKINKA